MEIKEVKKFLEEDSKGQKLLADLVEDHEAMDGLKTKNGDLIASNKKLKRERDDATSKSEGLESDLDELKSGSGKDVTDAVEKATKKAQKELDEANKKLGDSDSRIQKLVVDNGLADAITKANIAKSHIPAVKALLRAENKIEIDETDNVAKVGDKTLIEFVGAWAQGEAGKNYVQASNNSGGGAGGDGKAGNSANDDLMKLSPKQRLTEGRKREAAKAGAK